MRPVSMKNQIDALDSYTTTNGLASTRLDTTATALTSMDSLAQTISASLVSASSTGGSTTALQATGSSGLQALLSDLNTSVGDQYVFGGNNTGTTPATDYSSTSTAKTAVDASFSQTFGFSQTSDSASTISGSAMTSYLNGSFADQFSDSNWSANWSQASSTTISSKIAPSQTATTSVSANETAFRQIAEAYTMLSEFTGSNMSDDAKAAVVTKATTLMNTGLAALNQVQTGVGITQAAITSHRHGTERTDDAAQERCVGCRGRRHLCAQHARDDPADAAPGLLRTDLAAADPQPYQLPDPVSQRMYQACYDEVLEDDQAAARRVEFQALDRCVFLLGKAETAGVPSRESVDALHWTVQLWQTFLIELADDANVLPTELRAKTDIDRHLDPQAGGTRSGSDARKISRLFPASARSCATACAESGPMHITFAPARSCT